MGAAALVQDSAAGDPYMQVLIVAVLGWYRWVEVVDRVGVAVAVADEVPGLRTVDFDKLSELAVEIVESLHRLPEAAFAPLQDAQPEVAAG